MAKTRGPLFSVTASGTISKAVSFRTTKDGNIATGYHYPGSRIKTNPSIIQIERRNRFSELATAWANLSTEEKEEYNERAIPLRMTGWNLYLREGLNVTSFSTKPPPGTIINQSTPLSAVCVSSYLFNGSASTVVDGSGGGNDGNIIGNPITMRQATDLGVSLTNQQSSGSYVQLPSFDSVDFSDGFTMFVIVKNNSGGIVGQTVQNLYAMDGSNAPPHNLFLRNDGRVVYRVNRNGSAISVEINNGSSLNDDDEWHRIVVRYNNVTARMSITRLGVETTAQSNIGGTYAQFAGPGQLAGAIGGFEWIGEVAIMQVFNQSISDQDMANLIADPWYLYQP